MTWTPRRSRLAMPGLTASSIGMRSDVDELDWHGRRSMPSQWLCSAAPPCSVGVYCFDQSAGSQYRWLRAPDLGARCYLPNPECEVAHGRGQRTAAAGCAGANAREATPDGRAGWTPDRLADARRSLAAHLGLESGSAPARGTAVANCSLDPAPYRRSAAPAPLSRTGLSTAPRHVQHLWRVPGADSARDHS